MVGGGAVVLVPKSIWLPRNWQESAKAEASHRLRYLDMQIHRRVSLLFLHSWPKHFEKDAGKASERVVLSYVISCGSESPITGSEETAAVSRAVLLRWTPWCELRDLDTFKRKPKLRDSRAALRPLQEHPAGEWGGLDSPHLAPSGQSFEGKAWKLQVCVGEGGEGLKPFLRLWNWHGFHQEKL